MTKRFLLFVVWIINLSGLSAHESYTMHVDDMYDVFGLERNEELSEWMKFISSRLIDDKNSENSFSHSGESFNFYEYIQEKYSGFKCNHRLLFHWGYNSLPWSGYLEEKVKSYGWAIDVIDSFKQDLINEQKRRNSFANEYTENVFHYAHNGKQASFARALISIAYDVHILGDYEPDNTLLEGLQDINSVVVDICNNLIILDKVASKEINKKLKMELSNQIDIQQKSSNILRILKANVPAFIAVAQDGQLISHLNSCGYYQITKSVSIDVVNDEIEEDTVNKITTASTPRKIRSRHSLSGIIIGTIVFLFIIIFLSFRKK